jgi:hypothetical protein
LLAVRRASPAGVGRGERIFSPEWMILFGVLEAPGAHSDDGFGIRERRDPDVVAFEGFREGRA